MLKTRKNLRPFSSLGLNKDFDNNSHKIIVITIIWGTNFDFISCQLISIKYPYPSNIHNKLIIHINPIQNGLFGGCSRPSRKSVTHILQWWNFAVIPYPKKIQKICVSLDTPLEFCWHQHFFTGNQQILLYKEIQI